MRMTGRVVTAPLTQGPDGVWREKRLSLSGVWREKRSSPSGVWQEGGPSPDQVILESYVGSANGGRIFRFGGGRGNTTAFAIWLRERGGIDAGVKLITSVIQINCVLTDAGHRLRKEHHHSSHTRDNSQEGVMADPWFTEDEKDE